MINPMEMAMINSMKGAVKRIQRRAQARRDCAYLMSVDDRVLRDIGLNRGDLRIRVQGKGSAF